MWTSFSRSPLMPTYLLAMFVTDYAHSELVYQVGERNVQMRFWGRPDQIPYLGHIMRVVPSMLHYLETYVNQPFSLPKLDFITAPINLHFEAMENWGLILFRYGSRYATSSCDLNYLVFHLTVMTSFTIIRTQIAKMIVFIAVKLWHMN